MRTAMLLSVILLAGLTSVPATAAKDYYKWTDDEGVTHYSARRPHDKDAEVIRVSTGERVSVPASSSSAASGANSGSTQTSSTAENMKDPERCEAARENLDVLRNNAKVRMRDENGDIHYLSEDEKAEKSREFQQAIDEAC